MGIYIYIYLKNLLLLAGKVPNTPAHVLEPRAALARVARGDHFDPCTVKVRLIDPCDYLLNKILSGVEMASLSHIHRRSWLLLFYGGSSTVQYGFQVPINPLVSSHFSLPLSQLLSRETKKIWVSYYQNHSYKIILIRITMTPKKKKKKEKAKT